MRKAKIVFDPSEDPTSKRRSIGAGDTVGPKLKSPVAAADPAKEKQLSTEPVMQRRKTDVLPLTRTSDAGSQEHSFGNNSSGDLEPGCIVCERVDTKKGRFVRCIDCSSRGHFTCLRNSKFITCADDEPTWRCRGCQLCSACDESAILVSMASV